MGPFIFSGKNYTLVMLFRLVIVLALLVAGCSDAPADKPRKSRQDRAQAAEVLLSKTPGPMFPPTCVAISEDPQLRNDKLMNNVADGAPGVAPRPMTAGFFNNFHLVASNMPNRAGLDHRSVELNGWRTTTLALDPGCASGISLIPPQQYGYVRQTESVPAVSVPGVMQSRLNTGRTPPAYPTWRQGMKPMTWYEVGANVVMNVDPARDAAINPNYPGTAPWAAKDPLAYMCQEWSGGAWDEDRQTFWIFGGGHEGYFGNEGYSIHLDANAPTWQRRGYPTGSYQRPGYVASVYGDPAGRNAAGWGADGRPVAVHTYNLLTVLGNGRVFLAYGNGAYDSGPAGPSAVEFDPSTNDYDMSRRYAGNYPYFPPFGSAVYDPRRNVVWVTAGPRVIKYDPTALTGAILYGNLYGPEFSGRAIRIPEHDLIINVGGSLNNAGTGKSVAIIDPANPAAAPIGITAASNPIWYRYGVAYDTRRKRILGWPGGATIETLTPPAVNAKTGTWSYGRLLPSTAVVTPSAANVNGTYGRFFYSAKYDCAVVYNRTTEKLFVLPLS